MANQACGIHRSLSRENRAQKHLLFGQLQSHKTQKQSSKEWLCLCFSLSCPSCDVREAPLASKDSDSLVVFQRDAESGALSRTGEFVHWSKLYGSERNMKQQSIQRSHKSSSMTGKGSKVGEVFFGKKVGRSFSSDHHRKCLQQLHFCQWGLSIVRPSLWGQERETQCCRCFCKMCCTCMRFAPLLTVSWQKKVHGKSWESQANHWKAIQVEKAFEELLEWLTFGPRRNMGKKDNHQSWTIAGVSRGY